MLDADDLSPVVRLKGAASAEQADVGGAGLHRMDEPSIGLNQTPMTIST
ncbi:MAG: hypothetical protein ACT4PP_08215 [Sporichthyaceae bacterium]